MSDIESRFQEAVAAYERGEYAQALAGFSEVATVKPYASEVYLNLGNVHFRLDALDAADACFRKAIELDPMEASAYLNLGNLAFKQDKIEEAAACWEIYKTLNRQNANVWLNLGIAYDKLGEPEKAVDNYSVYLGLDPSSPETLRLRQRFENTRRMFENNVNVAAEQLERGRPEQAREALEIALAAYPGNATLYKTYASLLYQAKEYAEALKFYRRAYDLKPDDPAILVNLGVLYEKLEQPVSALWAYAQAKAIPGRDQAKVSERFESLRRQHQGKLGDALAKAQGFFRQGRIRPAEELLNQLMALSAYLGTLQPEVREWLEKVQEAQDPALKAARTYLARAADAETNGQFDQAMVFYQKFLALKPTGEKAEEVKRKLAHIRTVMAAVVHSLLDQG